MPTTTSPATDVSAISESMHAWTQALRSKDLAALMAHYAPDMVTFDLMPPLQLHGANAYSKNFARWFASVQGPIDYAMRDLRVVRSDDLAFCHYLGHVKSTRTTGEKSDYWVRVTSGLQKTNGHWTITHEHVSMPIDMETMLAARALEP